MNSRTPAVKVTLQHKKIAPTFQSSYRITRLVNAVQIEGAKGPAFRVGDTLTHEQVQDIIGLRIFEVSIVE